MKRLIASALVVSALTGCATEAFVVGTPGDAISNDRVTILYAERPGCHFETIAHITMENPHFSAHSMVSEMRFMAAQLGADALYVEHTQRLPNRLFVGSARAIRCVEGETV